MASTTNYGWSTPDNTALVKDGASAIRTLGSSIDTTLKAQIDAQIPDALLTTTGDTIYASGASTPARLGIGSTGQVLTVAAGVPTWANAGGSPASATATVATSETTTSTTYTNLATAGPAVTLTTGTKALVIITSFVQPSGTNNSPYVAVAVSGATTIASADATALNLAVDNSMNVRMRASAAVLLTLTSGSNTFTLQYRATNSGTTATFANRNIFVMNLG